VIWSLTPKRKQLLLEKDKIALKWEIHQVYSSVYVRGIVRWENWVVYVTRVGGGWRVSRKLYWNIYDGYEFGIKKFRMKYRFLSECDKLCFHSYVKLNVTLFQCTPLRRRNEWINEFLAPLVLNLGTRCNAGCLTGTYEMGCREGFRTHMDASKKWKLFCSFQESNTNFRLPSP
jgi:hypothetical protein